MSLYSSYSDEDLAAEIADLKARIIAAGKSGQAGVKAVTGEGRKLEFFSGAGGGNNISALQKLLASAELELSRRNSCGQAIGVNF